MLTVFKYELPADDMVELDLPEGARHLHFGNQFDVPCLWCMVDTQKPKVKHRFRFAGTGHDDLSPYIAEELQFIGSAMFQGGSLVFHLFYVKP